jgi:hypothetical protein
MNFYELGREDGTFHYGIETALQRLLTDPKFPVPRRVRAS